MTVLPIKNHIIVAKATCLLESREACAAAWDRVEEVCAAKARRRQRDMKNRSIVVSNKISIEKIKKLSNISMKQERQAEKNKRKAFEKIINDDFFINID